MDEVSVLDRFGDEQVALVQLIDCPHPVGGEEKHQDTSLWEGKMEEKGDNKEEMGFLTRLAAGGDSLGRGLPEERSVGRQGLQLVQRVC